MTLTWPLSLKLGTSLQKVLFRPKEYVCQIWCFLASRQQSLPSATHYINYWLPFHNTHIILCKLIFVIFYFTHTLSWPVMPIPSQSIWVIDMVKLQVAFEINWRDRLFILSSCISLPVRGKNHAQMCFGHHAAWSLIEHSRQHQGSLTQLRIFLTEENEVSDALAVSCGSRAHLEEESVASRSIFRTVLMYGFHALVWLFAVRGVRDTQCGFKLLTRRAGRILFNSLHVERWWVFPLDFWLGMG